MSESFISEIRIFAFDFPPRNWAACNGQLLSIQQNAALFSLIGTYYGGNGVQTFALPDLRGRAPMGFSNNYPLGTPVGTATVTLLSTEMPQHKHGFKGTSVSANSASPANAIPASDAAGTTSAYSSGATNGVMAADTLATVGNSVGHNNMQPSTVVNFCITLFGIFPSRN